jgi:hypothetical protein
MGKKLFVIMMMVFVICTAKSETLFAGEINTVSESVAPSVQPSIDAPAATATVDATVNTAEPEKKILAKVIYPSYSTLAIEATGNNSTESLVFGIAGLCVIAVIAVETFSKRMPEEEKKMLFWKRA